jgi:hypothetical protein
MASPPTITVLFLSVWAWEAKATSAKKNENAAALSDCFMVFVFCF